MNCRHCHTQLHHEVIDLGHQPPSNAYLSPAQLTQNEVYAPLRVYFCDNCGMVQIPSHHRPEELFTNDYAYFSSVSSSWVAHAQAYVAAMVERFALSPSSFIVEVASNDGYLLQFVKQLGIRCLGVEPAASTAATARSKGIESKEVFFGEAHGRSIANAYGPADLMVANNVLAHVPDINDFVSGFRELLAPDGLATFEFPHVMSLIDGAQFDTIYHEHYSYLSLSTVTRICESQGLRVFDVEEVSTHGGSLRVFTCHASASHPTTTRVRALLEREQIASVLDIKYYSQLKSQAAEIKFDLLSFLVEARRSGKTVAAYGAAAKGNTLLNYAGISADLIDFVCDGAPSKQGRFLPGSHIPILPPDSLRERKPDFVLILPWNIKNEIVAQHGYVRDWGGKFVVAVPQLEVE